MKEFILGVIGYAFLWAAVYFGNEMQSSIKLFSKNWWIILILMLIGVTILKYN